MALLLLFSGIFGLAVGSFLNVVIYRMHKGESFIHGRSHCMHCGHTLSWYELIPLLSFIAQKGKCRKCGAKISFQYPLVEGAVALLFIAAVFVAEPLGLLFLAYLFLIFATLFFIFVYDLFHYIIPDSAIVLLAIAAAAWSFYIGGFSALLTSITAGVLLALPFLAIVLISRGKWMGMGDVKLALTIGLILGLASGALALFLAIITGAIIGVGLIAINKKNMKSAVPFGPFLVIGTFASFVFGDALIRWYATFFLF